MTKYRREINLPPTSKDFREPFLTDARGLGVGRRPPPGIIPATALAGASSDIALDSSGMTPGEKELF